MKILSLDLGKYKTVACEYEGQTGEHSFSTIGTTPKALHDLIVDREPDRVVIEICPIAGWVCDLVRSLETEIQVANTAEDTWRWRKVKKKNDRQDALKGAQLSAVNQIRTVYVPQRETRQWRALIAYRQQLVDRRRNIKNHIRDLLLREGELLARGDKAWNMVGLAALEKMARPLEELGMGEFWRGELGIELQQFKQVQQQLERVEKKLNAIGEADKRVQLLRTIPGVGPRLSEAIVALIDDAGRFSKSPEVSSYIGMVPKELDSGETVRRGRITRHGSRLVRSLLVEVAWAGLRHNSWVRETYQRISGGKKSRKKIAIVAVGRRLLVRCWAMLRDGQPWRWQRKTVLTAQSAKV